MATYDLYNITTTSTSAFSGFATGDTLYANQSGPIVWTQDYVNAGGKTFTIRQRNAGYVVVQGTSGNVTIELENLYGKRTSRSTLPTDVGPLLSSYNATNTSTALRLTIKNIGTSINSIQASNAGNNIYGSPDIVETITGGLGADYIELQENDFVNLGDANGDFAKVIPLAAPLAMLSATTNSTTAVSDPYAVINGVDPADLLIIAGGSANEQLIDKSGLTKDKALADPEVNAQSSTFLLLVALIGKGGSGKFELYRITPYPSVDSSLWGQDKIAEISTASGYNGDLGKQIVADTYTVSYFTFEDAPIYFDKAQLASAVGIQGFDELRLSDPTGNNNNKLSEIGGYYLFKPDLNDDTAATFEFDVLKNGVVVGSLSVNADILPLHDPTKRYSIDLTKNSFTTFSPSSSVKVLSFQGGAYQISVLSPNGGVNVNADGPSGSSFGVGNTAVDGGEEVVFDPLGYASVDSFTLGFNSFDPGETATVTVTAIKSDGMSVVTDPFLITPDPISQITNFPQAYTVGLAALSDLLQSQGKLQDGEKLLGIDSLRVKSGSTSSYKMGFAFSGFSDLDLGTPDADDPLTGTADPDTIYGFAGDDRILGLDGDDLIRPGAGANTIDGGAGADVIEYFRGQGDAADTIVGTPTGDYLIVNGAASVTISKNQDGNASTNDWRLTASYVGFLPETFDFLLPTDLKPDGSFAYSLIPGPTPTGAGSFPTPYSAQIVAA